MTARLTLDGERVRKAERVRLARAELVMFLSMKADLWAADMRGTEPGVRPFDEWPADDPFRSLGLTYGLDNEDLADILDALAHQLEERALRLGWAANWDGDDYAITLDGYSPRRNVPTGKGRP